MEESMYMHEKGVFFSPKKLYWHKKGEENIIYTCVFILNFFTHLHKQNQKRSCPPPVGWALGSGHVCN